MSEEPQKKPPELRPPEKYLVHSDRELRSMKAIAETMKSVGWTKKEIPDSLRDLVSHQRFANLGRAIEAEEELILRMRLVEWFRAVVKIDQTPYLLSNELCPADLLVVCPEDRPSFIPQCCLIEVKATKDWSWSISESDFNRRRKFAESCGLPLFYAVRLGAGAWCLLPSDELEKRERKIGLEDYTTSWWDEFIGDSRMLVVGGMTITEHWAALDETFQPVCVHEEFGGLRSFEIIAGDKKYTGPFAANPLTHALFSFLPGTESREKHPSGKLTVTKQLEPSCLRFGDFVLDVNFRTTGVPNTPSECLRWLSLQEKHLPVRWHIASACVTEAELQGFLVSVQNFHGKPEMHLMEKAVLTTAHVSPNV